MAEGHRVLVPPVPPGEARPRWSVMIPTYHCAGYLREALAGVVEQDPGAERMQIEVVDDHSTADDPEAVVRELGGGRVGFYRQPRNVGHVRNFETCLLRSRGELVHLLHGDDGVRPGFYQTMERHFEDDDPRIGAAFCRGIFANERGDWIAFSRLERPDAGIAEGWLETLAVRQRLTTPTVVVRREVYERLGGFDRRLGWCEDWEMWVRIASRYCVRYEPAPLAIYRTHGTSSSSRQRRTAENVRDERLAIEIISEHLPDASAGRIARRARRLSAIAAIGEARRSTATGDWETARAQAREALRSSHDASVLLRFGLLGVGIARRALRRSRPVGPS